MSKKSPPSTPEKTRMSEAGDQISDMDMSFQSSSGNDGLEQCKDLISCSSHMSLSPEQIADRMIDLSCSEESRLICRSDLIPDWRKSGKSKFFPEAQASKWPNMLTGPDQKAVEKLCEETGYKHTVTPRQRTYGPPRDWKADVPGDECQVFVGKIPKQLFEDTLVPLFAKAGKIYQMRIMMEGAPSVLSRGFGFVVYSTQAEAEEAVKELDNWEILSGYHIKVAISPPLCRLLISRLPKFMTEEAAEKEIRAKLPGVTSVQLKTGKRICFVSFKDHQSAAQAKKDLIRGAKTLFSLNLPVDFADPIPEPDEQVMSQVRSVFVKGLPSHINEVGLNSAFSVCGDIEMIRLVKGKESYAFVHFVERSQALKCIEMFNNTKMQGSRIQVMLAKPPVDPAVKTEAMIRRVKRLENQKKSGIGSLSGPFGKFRSSELFRGRKYFVVEHGVVVSNGVFPLKK